VTPGDQLRIEVEMLAWKALGANVAVRISGKATVEGKLVCDATLSCQLVGRPAGQKSSESAEGEPAE
jgi:3-hydroxyacyl-[acyl-carrier-protein] dehydratase